MKIAILHNHYQFRGGEDEVFAAERHLLQAKHHTVRSYAVTNHDVASINRGTLAIKTIWNQDQYARVKAWLGRFEPDLVHVHNTLPLLSPAVYYAARASGAAVVQTLHNYRYSCVNGLFYRNGHICEDCLGKPVAWPGVMHACYRQSRAASSVVASMLAYHKLRGTYHSKVDRYIALTEFSRRKFIEMGLPADKLLVKPNFVAPDPGPGTGDGGYAVFVGRLTEEKGLGVLLAEWQRLGTKMPLKVIGSGPLQQVAATAGRSVEYLGQLPRVDVINLLKGAHFLVFPSLWYEGFPMTIAEALATGTPVLASRIGNQASIIEHGRTGIHFDPGNPDDLGAKVEWLMQNPKELARMRAEARQEYETKYTAETNYRMLMGIYEDAICASRS